MSWKYRHALVRPPPRGFADGITSAREGSPQLDLALAQHAAYCDALRECGLSVQVLPADDRFPDSSFVEDTAVIADRLAIATVPGAASRVGEVAAVAEALSHYRPDIHEIIAPGSVDGGDICQVEEHFFIGLSHRTNDEGAHQLATILRAHGYSTSTINIRNSRKLLHLKSGMAYLGDRRLAVMWDFPLVPELLRYELLRVSPDEQYAANCLRINERVLIAAGFPRFREAVRRLGLAAITLDMSEFRKMDGGLSCLSLRF